MGKIAAAAVTAALFGTVVRRGSPELALLLTVTAGVWILTAVLDGLGAAAAMAERLAQLAQMDAAVAGPVLADGPVFGRPDGRGGKPGGGGAIDGGGGGTGRAEPVFADDGGVPAVLHRRAVYKTAEKRVCFR